MDAVFSNAMPDSSTVGHHVGGIGQLMKEVGPELWSRQEVGPVMRCQNANQVQATKINHHLVDLYGDILL